ncbi:hypothetical protein D3C80_1880250 [compost metagenome]
MGQEAAEAPAEAMHLMATVEQPLHENAHVFGLGQGLGVDEVALTGGQVLAPGIALLQFGPRFQQGAGGAQAMVHVTEQCILEFGVTAKPEFFHQPHDGRVADAGMVRQA